MTLCVVTFILDVVYIVAFHVMAARLRAAAPAGLSSQAA